jgi:integrase
LDAEELKKLLAELQNPAHVLVFLTAATGLRVSEALGLKWSDVDFGTGVINLCRAVVHQHVGEMKTEASEKPVPMDGALSTALCDWSTQTPYRQPRRLGVRQPENEREATLLAGNTTEVLCAARCEATTDREANRLAFFPENVRNAAKGQR